MNLSVIVKRLELGLPDLELEAPGNFHIIRNTLGPGAAGWRRQTVTSPFVHGEILIGAVRDIEQAALGVRIRGSDAAQVAARIQTVVNAFSQFSYHLYVTMDGALRVWECQPADYSIGDGGTYQGFHWTAKQQEIRLQIPRSPIDVVT